MFKIIIAENPEDIIITDVPEAGNDNTALEVPAQEAGIEVPATNNHLNSVNKSLMSFSILIILLIIAIVIFYAFGKVSGNKKGRQKYTVPDYAANAAKKKKTINKDTAPHNTIAEDKISLPKLETPSSLAECIKNFLERTK